MSEILMNKSLKQQLNKAIDRLIGKTDINSKEKSKIVEPKKIKPAFYSTDITLGYYNPWS